MRSNRFLPLLMVSFCLSTAIGADGIRVVTWNITYYGGDRHEQIGTVAYGQWNGRSLDPDLICLQEMNSRLAVFQFVAALNNAPGSPGDWRAAPVYEDPRGGHGTALVYRESKLEYVDSELVAQGGPPPQQPRNVVRFDMRPAGYDEPESLISVFPLHFKAFYSQSDIARKLVEAQILRGHILTLPADRHVVLGADLNIQRSTDPAYEELNGEVPNTGVLRDPISTPGNWNNNPAFRNIHTQDPTGGGGMDDRLDQILLSPSLLDGHGLEYDGVFPTPWDLGTPENPNHSYRAWGNDGTSYNLGMRIAGNAMVGSVIAQAIADLADPNGHIPVYLDLDVAPRIRIVGQEFDLGTVRFDASPELLVRVGNDADTQRWGPDGIAPLRYSFTTDGPAIIPTGGFVATAGAQLNAHLISIDTCAFVAPGPQEVRVLVSSDDPGAPESVIDIHLDIVGCSPADLAAPLGQLSFFDLARFIELYNAGDPGADLAAPEGTLDFFDFSAFILAYREGCRP